MEYIKQTWTSPTGTGLSRYAKSGESASHVTLTLDPENLTNSPTPFTMERMAHIEEGIAKAYDTAPPTPWAQYSGKDIPQLPDNVAGTIYKRDNDWTTVDGWGPSHTSIALSVEDETLKAVYDGTRPDTGLSIVKSINVTGKFIKGRIKCTVPIISVRYYTGSAAVSFTLANPNAYETDFYGYIPTAFTDLVLYINAGQLTAKTCWLSQFYIGTGAYDRLVFDNSYHYRHLLNNAVVPTPQGLYFNGETSYLRSKEKITLPDVFTFSATVNCALKSTSQTFLAQNTSAQPTDRIIIYRDENANHLSVIGTDGTTSSVFFNCAGYFTGLDNTDIDLKVEIDFVSKTIKAYRNGVQFGSTVSAPTIIKPSSNYIYSGNLSNLVAGLLGYMRNICLFDTALTDTQRNWLAQGNTPPILYDVTNYETEGYASTIETLRKSANFTLGTYPDGKKIRIANTHTSNTITCTLPSGQTMNGAGTISIPAGRIIDIELIGTTWKDNLTGNLTGNASTATAPLYQWKKEGPNLYRYVAGETTTYYWHKICNITGAMTFDLELYSDTNYAYRASYRLSVTKFISGSTTTYTVSLFNLGQTVASQAKLAVAIDADGYLYIQTNCLWGSYLFVTLLYSGSSFSITMDKLGYALFGSASGFTPVKIITQTGGFRWTTSGTLSSITPIINTNIKGNVAGNLTGNASTADKWKTARNITISDADGTNTGTAVSVDGSENETLKLPATIKANVTGNADTATTASKITNNYGNGLPAVSAGYYGTIFYSTRTGEIGSYYCAKTSASTYAWVRLS